MQNLKRLAVWSLKAWPIILVGVIGAVHYSLLSVFPDQTTFLNKVWSAALQVLGGLIVLYSVNENMGMFRNHGILTVIANWFLSFPFIRRTITIKARSATAVGSSLTARITIKKKCNSVEERLDELERLIDECRALVYEREQFLAGRLEEARTELRSSISSQGTELQRLSTLMEKSVVGGFKSQAFGVLLVIYGAILGIFV